MNPIKWLWNQIYGLFKYVILDTWTDLVTIKNITKNVKDGKDIVDPEKWKLFKAELKKITLASLLKESWPWILAILFAGVCGYLLGGQYYVIKCNEFIMENYANNTIPLIKDFGYNLSSFFNGSL